AELALYKAQINPHFLFNALNSIYSLVLPHSELASDAVIKLSSILRYMLYEADKKYVSLDKEMEVIRDYLALQKFKFNDVTNVSFRIEGSLAGYSIEPLLLMTFVENAFKYGADNITPSFIAIDVAVIDGYFIMSVRNKIVIAQSKSENSGIGIKNIKRRLDLIYQENYMLDIKKEDGEIFSVKLKLKLL
ncbi:MAG: histidine kinase, partial [Rikenellaceae bacterium]